MNLISSVSDNVVGDTDHAAFGPLELLVLQATPFCNLNCSYCYLPDRDDSRAMDISIAELAVKRVLEADLVDDEFTVVWHAGEPLVLGVDYYSEAFDRIAAILPPGIKANHSFQTNGVLIDKRWCDFFKAHSVRLGLSIDGPEKFHDRYRKTRNGKGTHARVARAAQLLKEESVPFHVISVLTGDSIQSPELLYRYFDSLGIEYLCFNIEEIEGCNQNSTLLGQDRYGDYAAFLRRFYELREESRSDLKLREIDGAISSIVSWRSCGDAGTIHSQENTPFKILNVDVEGNYSTFSPELLGTASHLYGDFRLGNLADMPIKASMDDDHYRVIASAVNRGIRQCRSKCDYFDLCGGGSPSNKLAENHRLDSSETGFCRLQKKACVDVALEIMEERLGIDKQA